MEPLKNDTLTGKREGRDTRSEEQREACLLRTAGEEHDNTLACHFKTYSHSGARDQVFAQDQVLFPNCFRDIPSYSEAGGFVGHLTVIVEFLLLAAAVGNLLDGCERKGEGLW
mmetsp:Transcript_63887/g.133143  ORF Transcript_63887/g.133143 Transcript_63887/m.133143 type:complete len:113 (+) Transcript_63887:1105-1443(+)